MNKERKQSKNVLVSSLITSITLSSFFNPFDVMKTRIQKGINVKIQFFNFIR